MLLSVHDELASKVQSLDLPDRWTIERYANC